LAWVRDNDGLFPYFYCGIPIKETLERIGLDADQFKRIYKEFTNMEIHPIQEWRNVSH